MQKIKNEHRDSLPALAQMIPLYGRFKQDPAGVPPLGAREAKGSGNVRVLQATQLEQGIVEVHGFPGKSKTPLIVREGETILRLACRWILGPHLFSYLELL
ncbi:MAG: hypothetical protein JSW35_05600 [Deltaproteobacteria bacterium]|nr:MAG: hypothetical protein JSW35_05600 [Deltaproteobacteria bacterium]